MFRRWLSRKVKPVAVSVPPARPAAPPLLPGQAFTPTQPCSSQRGIIGRLAELERILQALCEERAHVVLYSERGRGKTTLANLVVETLRMGDVMVARHTCDAGSSFDTVMRGLAGDLPRALMAAPANDPDEVGCEAALPPHRLRPADVIALPSRLTCRRLVFVVDEFDRVKDTETRTLLADTIKQLSDHAVPLLFMLVGVSENLEQILGQHPSIERNLAALPLPLLTETEVASLIARGAKAGGFTLEPAVAKQAVALVRGSPHAAQLVGLRLVQAAARRGDTVVRGPDLAKAIVHLLAATQPQTLTLHDTLIAHGTDAEMVWGLRVLASAAPDAWGRIHATQSSSGGVLVGGAPISETAWARLLDLRAAWPDSAGAYFHANRALMHHILLSAAAAPGASLVDAVPGGTDGADETVTQLAAAAQ